MIETEKIFRVRIQIFKVLESIDIFFSGFNIGTLKLKKLTNLEVKYFIIPSNRFSTVFFIQSAVLINFFLNYFMLTNLKVFPHGPRKFIHDLSSIIKEIINGYS